MPKEPGWYPHTVTGTTPSNLTAPVERYWTGTGWAQMWRRPTQQAAAPKPAPPAPGAVSVTWQQTLAAIAAMLAFLGLLAASDGSSGTSDLDCRRQAQEAIAAAEDLHGRAATDFERRNVLASRCG